MDPQQQQQHQMWVAQQHQAQPGVEAHAMGVAGQNPPGMHPQQIAYHDQQQFYWNAGASTFVPGQPPMQVYPQHAGGHQVGYYQQQAHPGYYHQPPPQQGGAYYAQPHMQQQGYSDYNQVQRGPQGGGAPPPPGSGGGYHHYQQPQQQQQPPQQQPPQQQQPQQDVMRGGGRGGRGRGGGYDDGGRGGRGGRGGMQQGGQKPGSAVRGAEGMNWRDNSNDSVGRGGRGGATRPVGRGGKGGKDEALSAPPTTAPSTGKQSPSPAAGGTSPQPAASPKGNKDKSGATAAKTKANDVASTKTTKSANTAGTDKAEKKKTKQQGGEDDDELPDDWEQSVDTKDNGKATDTTGTDTPTTTPGAEKTESNDKKKVDTATDLQSDGETPTTNVVEEEAPKAVRDTPKFKIQPVDSRPHLNIVFIGHVDAGKSTTCGNILFLTEQIDQRTIDKYEREAKEKNRDTWFFAYIMDINDEERAKGKTVEVGRALFDTPNRRFTILDAPGHKSFVPNMISGAAQADVAVLIISARKGEFETGFERGGQTREHAMLAKTLGVNQIVVAVNKMDDPTCDWDEERFRDIEKKLTPFLRSCGYNPAKDIFFIPISGLAGQNLKFRVGDPHSPCYVEKGKWHTPDNPSLLELLDSLSPPDRSPSDPLRVPLLEGYRDQGVIAPGKVESGTISINENAIIMPGKLKVRIAGLLVNEQEVSQAPPGENVAVRVVGVEEDSLQKGSVLSSVIDPCPVVSKFKCQVMIVDLLEHRPILTAGYNCVLHAHTVCEDAQFEELLEVVDKATKRKKTKPQFVKSNAMLTCTMTLTNAVCLEPFSIRPQLGRFTIRDEGRTIGVGKVLEIIE